MPYSIFLFPSKTFPTAVTAFLRECLEKVKCNVHESTPDTRRNTSLMRSCDVTLILLPRSAVGAIYAAGAPHPITLGRGCHDFLVEVEKAGQEANVMVLIEEANGFHVFGTDMAVEKITPSDYVNYAKVRLELEKSLGGGTLPTVRHILEAAQDITGDDFDENALAALEGNTKPRSSGKSAAKAGPNNKLLLVAARYGLLT